MKKKILMIITIYAMSVCLAACTRASGNDNATAETQTMAEETPKKEEPSGPVTEEDFRNAIASETDDENKLKTYKDFASNYKMNKDEYLEYASLCEKAGDTVSERRALYLLYISDPTEENGERLSDMTLKITDSDDQNAGTLLEKLADEIGKCEADATSVEGVRSIIASDDWKASFHIDNGTFTSKTEYTKDGLCADISSDSVRTRVIITKPDKKYACDVSYDGTSVAYGEVKDGKPEGGYFCQKTDPEGIDIVIVKGYYNNDHYVNQCDITIGESVYHAAFDDDGKTKEKQPEGFKGVVYAYTDDGNNYLYVTDGDVSDWVASIKDLGFEDFEND